MGLPVRMELGPLMASTRCGGASLVAQKVKNLSTRWETQV